MTVGTPDGGAMGTGAIEAVQRVGIGGSSVNSGSLNDFVNRSSISSSPT
jgi:hypothetical protein